ncbi:MAG: ADP-ribose pyrophosphatase [Candidatus Jorgensenbacteria bacterium GW2011_GWA1_48_11]|uniref:ADP-ribose pyrophosphatase n=1 Tax=Candidatus Jorgensenbacteria bacterium GW2011_GWA1_48_11 TaxID=1618660 RepID=A0A0G1WLI5_9BACT|nr:MAG: ADP-ribose pyrophosphatase [Candidatus Jorgensenbacteria bacterium GW2011_GWA1_48_11]KKW11864.1 MAG: ADP-ribose pyrophosphatase [Candidatus Jorgensenbacteria bacterium GW2011_GWB1_49_9]
MKQFIASKAFVVRDGKILIVRESAEYKGGTNIGKYILPGGKIKPGESHIEALKREMREECGLEVKVGAPFFVTQWQPEINGEKIQIIAVFFECLTESDRVTLDSNHGDFQWINPGDYDRYDLNAGGKDAFRAYLERSQINAR